MKALSGRCACGGDGGGGGSSSGGGGGAAGARTDGCRLKKRADRKKISILTYPSDCPHAWQSHANGEDENSCIPLSLAIVCNFKVMAPCF